MESFPSNGIKSSLSSINHDETFLPETTSTENDPLFQPKDIYSCIRPLVYFYKIFGFVGFAYHRRPDARGKYQSSFSGSVYSVMGVVVMTGIAFFVERSFAGLVYATKSTVTTSNDHLQMHGPMLLVIIALITAQYQQDIINCIDSLAEVDSTLKRFGVVIPHRKNQTFLIGFLASGIVALCAFFYSDAVIFHNDNIYFPPWYWVGYTFPKVLSWIAYTAFLAWVLTLKQRLAVTNKLILESAHQDLEMIRTLPGIHGAICTIARTVNGVHSFQLLALVTILFCDILSSTYFLLRELFLMADGKEAMVGMIYFEAYWILWFVSITVLLCSSCTAVRNEANLTGDNVHKAYRKTYDSAIMDELQLFSCQLLHGKISFNACGFFSLGMPLVCSMAGAVTTYLVILVQFEMVDTPSAKETEVLS